MARWISTGSREELWRGSRAYQTPSQRKLVVKTWMVSRARASPPPRRSGFVRSTINALSRRTVELSSSGRWLARKSSKVLRKRVPRWKSPSSPRPSERMAPPRSKTPKLSPCFRTRVRSSGREPVARMEYGSWVETVFSSMTVPFDLLPVDPHVVARHARGREPPLERCPAAAAGDFVQPVHGRDRLFDRGNHESALPLVQDLGHRAAAEGDDGGAAGHGLDHHQPERLRPVDGEEHGTGIAQETLLHRLADLPYEIDLRLVEQRLDGLLVIGEVRAVDLGRHAQREARAAGDLDGTVEPFLGGCAGGEAQVGPGLFDPAMEVHRHPVVDVLLPVEPVEGVPLSVRDRR